VIIPDVNVWIGALRPDAEHHSRYREWLTDAMNAPEDVGVSDLILSGVLRIVTNSRAFREPTPLGEAIDALDRIRAATGTSQVRPGSRHWSIFTVLCRSVSASSDPVGKLVPDAYHAALAIEIGATLITADRDFFSFPGLAVSRPFD
jgi:toxin-antitoxin system PIN domain toxin